MHFDAVPVLVAEANYQKRLEPCIFAFHGYGRVRRNSANQTQLPKKLLLIALEQAVANVHCKGAAWGGAHFLVFIESAVKKEQQGPLCQCWL